MGMKLITPPAPLITWSEADQHLRLSGDETDRTLVETFIAAATEYIDGWNGILGRAFMPQTWELSLDEFPCDAIQLNLPPIISLTSVKYDDADGVEQTEDTDNYYVDTSSSMPWVVPVSGYSWPTTLDGINALRVRFVAGYVDGVVPAPIKAAVLLMTGDLYEQRKTFSDGSVSAVPMSVTVERLIAPYRQPVV